MNSLVPLVVKTFGRTGSTLLMQILATDRRVVFERQYPFEHRYLTYAYNLSRVVKEPVSGEAAWGNDTLFQGQSPYVGGLPYEKMDCLDPARLAKKLFPAVWSQFSEVLREERGLTADEPVFYAEKSPHLVCDLAMRDLGAKCIYLLRDPRDEMVSIKSFNAKRGYQAFGYLKSDSDKSFAKRIIQRRKNFMRQILDNKPGDQRFYLRYEDLVNQGEAEIRRLSDWLGMEFDLRAATQDSKIQDKHMTSSNFSSSVERWRTELEPKVQTLFRKELGTELTELGYPL